MHKAFFLLCTFFVYTRANAQYSESIRSARPGQSIGAFTTGARVFQIQSGVSFKGFSEEHPPGDGRGLNILSVFRYGPTEHFEVSTVLAYQFDWRNNDGIDEDFNGLSSVILRMRSNLFVGTGAIPSVGFQVNLGLPILSKEYDIHYVAPRVTVMTNQKFAPRLSLTTNTGINWNGDNEKPQGFYTLNLGFKATGKISLFAEHYATVQKNDWDGFADAGFAYVVNNDLQLDLFGGYSKNDKNFSEFFISTGVSWRVRFKNEKYKD